MTVSGNGSSTLTIKGTAEEIYNLLDSPTDPFIAYPATASTASTASIPANSASFPVDNGTYQFSASNFSSVLTYTEDRGYIGSDAVTVTAQGTNASSTSPIATSKLLLEVRPTGPSFGGYGGNATLLPLGTGPSAIIEFGNPGDPAPPIYDPQAGINPIQVSVSAGYGTMTLTGTNGLTVTGDGTDSLELIGSVTDINNALQGMTYTPGSNFAGSDTLALTINDQGYNDQHQVETGTSSIPLQAQWLTVPGTQDMGTAGSLAFNTANGNAISVADFDPGGGNLQVELDAEFGTLALGNTAGVTVTEEANNSIVWVEGTASAINSDLQTLVYTPNGTSPSFKENGFTYDQLDVSVQDLGSAKISGFGQGTFFEINAGAGNTPAAPPGQGSITAPPLQAVGLGTPVTFSSAGGNAIVINNPGEPSDGIVYINLSATYGTLTLSQTTGITFTNGLVNGGSELQFQGTLADVNAALDGMVYTPDQGFVGVDTVQLDFFGDSLDVAWASIPIDEGADNVGVPISAPLPVQTSSGGAPVVFSSASGNAITLGNPGISATTPVQLTLSIADGTLSLAGTSGISIVSGANGSSQMTIQGTLAALNSALEGLTYAPGAGDLGQTELDLTASVPGDSSFGTTFASALIDDTLDFVPAVITVPPSQAPAPPRRWSFPAPVVTASRSTIRRPAAARCR